MTGDLVYSVHKRARNVGVLCQKGVFAESNAHGPHVCQRNVNYAHWNVILIAVLEHEDDKQEWREGCFTADLAVNVFSSTIHRWWKVLTIRGAPMMVCA